MLNLSILTRRCLRNHFLKYSTANKTTSWRRGLSNLSYHSNQGTNQPLVGQTLQERLDLIAARRPNDLVYKFCATQTSLTYRELQQRVNELAQSLMQQYDLRKGDRVALMLPNVPELVVSLFAIAQIGCISVLMNPAYNVDEIEYMLRKTRSKAAIILDNFRVGYYFRSF